jgi:hypothetical protein
MATLNPSNVVNGNTIQASDILQLFEAFGTGSQNITGLSLTGSITNATTALTSSITNNIVVPTTSSGIYYPVIVDGAGTKSPKILSTFELSGSVLNNVTASRAITSSFSLNSTVTQVNTQYYDNGVNTIPADFKFVAGKVAMTNGAATSSIFTNLIGKVLGDTVWINASYPTTFTPFTSSVTVNPTPGPPYTTNLSMLKVNVSSSGQVLITGGPNDTGTIIFTGIYI